MIQISHEFPNYFYQNGYAESHTDYDYCLVHRYAENESYRDYMRNSSRKGRQVFIDNGVFELQTAFPGDTYAKEIEDLQPTYYLLPDVFNDLYKNIESQLDFYEKYGKSLPGTPMSALQGKTSAELAESFKILSHELPNDTRFALPFGSAAFDNRGNSGGGRVYDPWLYNPEDIRYTPLRMALNRKKFLRLYHNILRERDFHLLGCKSLAEYDFWGKDFDKSFIKSTDTSLPVAMTLQGNIQIDSMSLQNDNLTSPCICMDTHFYKPSYLIDKHFDDTDFGDISNMDSNIEFFRSTVRSWYEN